MPDSIRGIAPGIFELSTPSHGGFFLAPERWEILQKLFPNFKPFAGKYWLEEDCDAVLAPLAFPEAFKDERVFYAVHYVRMLKMPNYADAVRYLETAAAKPILERAAKYHAANPDALKR